MTGFKVSSASRPDLIALIFQTECDTTDWAIGQRLFEALSEKQHDLTPDEIGGHGSSARKPYYGPESAREFWTPVKMPAGAFTPKWEKLRSPLCEANMKHTFLRKDGKIVPGGPNFYCKIDHSIAWMDLFVAICGIFQIRSAFLDVTCKHSHAKASSLEGVTESDTWIRLRGHAVGLSRQYLSDRILADVKDASFPVREIGGIVIISVSEDPLDQISSSGSYASRQNQLKAILNPENRKLLKHRPTGDSGWEAFETDE